MLKVTQPAALNLALGNFYVFPDVNMTGFYQTSMSFYIIELYKSVLTILDYLGTGED
jgi:hypothetical protein